MEINNKKEVSKRSFVPKKIGESLQNISKKYANKYGKVEYLILSKWPQIVGSFFADHSEPEKISRIPDGENEVGEIVYSKYLHVNVSPAAAIDFQHFKNKIIDKINSYFGYKAIIDIRLQQNFVPKKNIRELKVKKSDVRNKKIINKKINNKDLEKSLEKLEQSIIEMGD